MTGEAISRCLQVKTVTIRNKFLGLRRVYQRSEDSPVGQPSLSSFVETKSKTVTQEPRNCYQPVVFTALPFLCTASDHLLKIRPLRSAAQMSGRFVRASKYRKLLLMHLSQTSSLQMALQVMSSDSRRRRYSYENLRKSMNISKPTFVGTMLRLSPNFKECLGYKFGQGSQ